MKKRKLVEYTVLYNARFSEWKKFVHRPSLPTVISFYCFTWHFSPSKVSRGEIFFIAHTFVFDHLYFSQLAFVKVKVKKPMEYQLYRAKQPYRYNYDTKFFESVVRRGWERLTTTELTDWSNKLWLEEYSLTLIKHHHDQSV